MLLVEGHPENHSIVVRNAVLLYRIVAIFTMLRKFDANDKSDVYYCCDEDFNTAFAMAKVFMEHALLILTLTMGHPNQKSDGNRGFITF